MPNHVTHHIVISGLAEDLDKFFATFFTAANQGFDFETIIPMPTVLKDAQSGYKADIGLFLLGQPSSVNADIYLNFQCVKDAGVTTEDELKVFLSNRYPNALKEGEKCLQAIAETGHANWYDWSIANWGTKWNAYSCDWIRVDPELVQMNMDTAWDTCEPIWQALANRPEVQNLRIKIDAFDEGWFFAYHATIEDGEYDGSYVEATAEIYEQVYGVKPETDDEDQG